MTSEPQAVIDAATALAEHHKSTNGYTHESWRSQQIFLLQNVLDAVDRLAAPGPKCDCPRGDSSHPHAVHATNCATRRPASEPSSIDTPDNRTRQT